MNEELQFARGVYAATKMFIHGRLPSYKLDDKAIKDWLRSTKVLEMVLYIK